MQFVTSSPLHGSGMNALMSLQVDVVSVEGLPFASTESSQITFTDIRKIQLVPATTLNDK